MSSTKWLQKQEHFDWMQKCLTCWKMCEEFMIWSIKNGKYVSSINACRDVTEMCSQCIKFEAQRSPFFQQLCYVCAEICERFAGEIEKFAGENQVISDTVSSCITFAKTCRQLAEKQNTQTLDPKDNFTGKQGDKI